MPLRCVKPQKAYYSNYGVGKAVVSAPGGDARTQFPPPRYRGLGRRHRRVGDDGQKIQMRDDGGRVDPPDHGEQPAAPRSTDRQYPLFATATCQGNAGYNGYFGKGIIDALKAVTQYPQKTTFGG